MASLSLFLVDGSRKKQFMSHFGLTALTLELFSTIFFPNIWKWVKIRFYLTATLEVLLLTARSKSSRHFLEFEKLC